MRNIETFPSKYCTYLYLLLVERKVAAEFYHNIDMDIGHQALIGLVKMTYFHRYLERFAGVLSNNKRQDDVATKVSPRHK